MFEFEKAGGGSREANTTGTGGEPRQMVTDLERGREIRRKEGGGIRKKERESG